RALRKHKNGAGVPLLVTSAIYKDRVALGRLEQETGCEFFAKPFQLREMVRAVVRHLAEPAWQSRPQRRAQRPESPRVQEGSLADRGLPRVLIELFDVSATGVLSLA